ncbi:response regulator [Leptolyngbya sp. FACHB-261]|uniref:response regulator n=1 Tax=Leptolyngbya sp. FACHB-261 TaxID=2692806 RepID=UPI001685E0A3|nr:response regulator [Leptolyngbya sp. FACHB-261]MBD2104101.1 response regulator [Leptolyngbya sp. FACHB-261]
MEERPLILLVEDQEDNQQLLAFILESLGFSYVIAANGAIALELAQQQPLDLILLDIAIPEIDGLEVVRQLKADSKTSTIPVVAVTAMAMVGDRDRILAAGFDAYVSKPYILDDIEEITTRYLGIPDAIKY